MNRQQTNQSYYLKNKLKLQEQRRLKYQSQKSQSKPTKQKKLGDYYHANNIRILISLKDYLDSSPDRMKLWFRFDLVLSQIKEGVSDIIEIMRLREVMTDLISDYWTIAKKDIRIEKKWSKLSEKQKIAKQKRWAEELKAEERELFKKFEQQQAKQNKKSKSQEITENKSPQGKVQCPDCQRWVKELDEENNICSKCLAQYEN